MPKDFHYWKKLHESEQLNEFNSDFIGLLWLKTKSIIRKELIVEFTEQNKIQLEETASNKQFVELFSLLSIDPKNSHILLNNYIIEKAKKQLVGLDTEQLVSELFKLKYFEWMDTGRYRIF